MSFNIVFTDNEINSNLKQKTKLRHFITKQVLKETKKYCELSYVFCTDEFLLTLNQKHLNHDTLTDIITFDLTDNAEIISGEIYISIERVRENAKIFNCTKEEELNRVIFHGALHLCGYKDKSKEQKEIMRQMENKWLNEFKKTIS